MIHTKLGSSSFSFLAVLFLSSCQPTSPATISLQPKSTFQTISGWEITAALGIDPDDQSFPYYRDTVYDLAVNEIGVNRIRLEVRSGTESPGNKWQDLFSGKDNYDTWRVKRYITLNDNDDPFVINEKGFDFSELDFHINNSVIPIKQRLEARGESLYINLCYVAFIDQIKTDKFTYIHSDPEEYAEFMLANFLHIKNKFGFVPDAIEVILEPDNIGYRDNIEYHTEKWKWNGQHIGHAIVATAKRLEANGVKVKFIAPSVTNMEHAAEYFDQIADIPGALDHLTEFSYHRYGSRRFFSFPKWDLKKIVQRAKKHNISPAMLEWWFDYGTYHILHEDLKQGNNTAWQGHVLDKSLFDIDTKNPKQPIVSIKKVAKINLQYFKYIRSGAVRIAETSSNETLFDPIAFINPDGRYVVVMKASQGGSVIINDLPGGTYEASYTTEKSLSQQKETLIVTEGKSIQTSIPAAGALTISAVVPTQ